MNELKNKNIGFISITQPIDTTSPTGELLMNILACFAQFERTLIKERVKLGKERSKIKQGRKNKKINLETIKRLHEEGLSTYKISKEYNKLHKPFISHQTVHNILKNNLKGGPI